MVRKLSSITICAILVSAGLSWGGQYSAGHADVGVVYEEGEFVFHFHLGSGAVLDGVTLLDGAEFEPSEISVLVPVSAQISPTGAVPFLGTAPGQEIWVLPANNVPDLPYLGLATEELVNAEWNGPIRFELKAYSGPGEFALWVNNSFGVPVVKWRTNDGVDAADVELLSPRTHNHYNWGFTAPGIYQLEVQVSGNHLTDGAQSDTEIITFHVVPEPRNMLMIGAGAMILGARRRMAVRG